MTSSFETEIRDQVVIISVAGNILSSLDFKGLEDKIDELIQTDHVNLIIDLKNIAVINSLGVNGLIKTFTKCRNAGGDLFIVNISEKINHVLMLTKLNAVLNIVTSVEEAEKNILSSNES